MCLCVTVNRQLFARWYTKLKIIWIFNIEEKFIVGLCLSRMKYNRFLGNWLSEWFVLFQLTFYLNSFNIVLCSIFCCLLQSL